LSHMDIRDAGPQSVSLNDKLQLTR
jgi:hypothetical protein